MLCRVTIDVIRVLHCTPEFIAHITLAWYSYTYKTENMPSRFSFALKVLCFYIEFSLPHYAEKLILNTRARAACEIWWNQQTVTETINLTSIRAFFAMKCQISSMEKV